MNIARKALTSAVERHGFILKDCGSYFALLYKGVCVASGTFAEVSEAWRDSGAEFHKSLAKFAETCEVPV